MVLDSPGTPLREAELPAPEPSAVEVLIRGSACGECRYCLSRRENLCDRARFTGYHVDGGYAERLAADERFCLPLPGDGSDLETAPLLCAGLIGYRALRLAGEPERLGLYGFCAGAPPVAPVAPPPSR